MALKQRSVGKPSLSTVIGEGTSDKIHMPCAGEVYNMRPQPDDTTISRDPGQREPHMIVQVDPKGKKREQWRG